MTLLAVVVNYRTPELTSRAIESLLADDPAARVVVVDNDPDSRTEAFLAGRWTDSRVEIVVARRNLGFGGGVNLGVSTAPGDELFVLNSDAQVRQGCLAHLRSALRSDPSLGLVAPRVIQPDGAAQRDAYGQFPTLRTMITRSNRRPVETLEPDWVSGVAFLIRREVFDMVHGFDEGYWMYFEDIDLCRRLRASGWGIRRVQEAVVEHLGGASYPSTARQRAQYAASQQRYLRRSGYSPSMLHVVGLLRRPIDRVRSSIVGDRK